MDNIKWVQTICCAILVRGYKLLGRNSTSLYYKQNFNHSWSHDWNVQFCSFWVTCTHNTSQMLDQMPCFFYYMSTEHLNAKRVDSLSTTPMLFLFYSLVVLDHSRIPRESLMVVLCLFHCLCTLFHCNLWSKNSWVYFLM